MMSVKKVLDSLMKDFNGAETQFRTKTIDRESLIDRLEINKSELATFHTVVSDMSSKKLSASYSKMLKRLDDREVAKILGKDCVKVLRGLPRNISSKAQRSNGVFGAIKNSYPTMVQLNRDLAENMDGIMGNKAFVSVKDIRLSQSLVLGVIQASRVYSRFNSYLVAVISHVNTGTPEKLPRYVYKFLADNASFYTTVVNNLASTTGSYSIINDITNLKNNSIDVPALDGSAVAQAGIIGEVLGVFNIFLEGLQLGFKPLVWMCEQFIDMKDLYYRKMADEKVWLEQHIAILTMDLENVDPNDPKYVTLKKTVDYYNDKMADYDAKLDKYYRS